MQPRHYQVAAVQAVYEYLQKHDGNPCVVLPTGAGKTVVIAMICRDVVQVWGGRVLVLSHVKELLAQSEQKIKTLCPDLPVSLYSAGLGRKDASHNVVVAGVQSVYQKAEELGHFDIAIIDESHLITDSGDGMYRTLLHDLKQINRDLRIVGLTATPYRMTTGEICTPDGILNKVCYEIGIKQLIREGYLCKLVGKSASARIDTSNLKVVRGEYEESGMAAAFTEHLDASVLEILERTADRHSVLVFCSGIDHAEQVRMQLVKHASTEAIYGHTDSNLRDRYAREFRAGAIKYLVNVGVLTTGFDAPNIDAIVLLRATMSPGLYYQMCGRGLRIHEAKTNTLILDFGTNIQRHGPVDMVRPRKPKDKSDNDGEYLGRVCTKCGSVIPIDYLMCPDCGEQLPPATAAERNSKLSDEAADDDPISGKPKIEEHAVMKVTYKIHHKKGAEPGAPRTLRVTYQIGMAEWVSEWICVEHSGYAFDKACRWWSQRCKYPIPDNVVGAVTVARHGLLREPVSITIKRTPGNQFPEIKEYEFGEAIKPVLPTPCQYCGALNMWCVVRIPDDNLGSNMHHGQIICSDCKRHWDWASADIVEHYGFMGDPGVEPRGMLPYDFKEPPLQDHYEALEADPDLQHDSGVVSPEVPW